MSGTKIVQEKKNFYVGLIEKIIKLTSKSFEIDVDISRDRGKIYEQYILSEKEGGKEREGAGEKDSDKGKNSHWQQQSLYGELSHWPRLCNWQHLHHWQLIKDCRRGCNCRFCYFECMCSCTPVQQHRKLCYDSGRKPHKQGYSTLYNSRSRTSKILLIEHCRSSQKRLQQ